MVQSPDPAGDGALPDLAGDLDVRGVLDRLVAHAREATGAEHVRLEILGPDGAVNRSLESPSGPWSAGASASDDVVLGGSPAVQVTVSRRSAVPVFDDGDRARLAEVVRRAAPALRNARLHAHSEQRRTAAEVFLEVERALAAGTALDEVLLLVTRTARHVLGATGAFVLFGSSGESYEVRGAAVGGASRERLHRLVTLAQPDVEAVVATGEGREVQLDGEMMVVEPTEPVDDTRPFFALWFSGRATTLDEHERALLDLFVEQVRTAVGRLRGVSDRQRAAVAAERARIAQDLHDVVIQRIFASGLGLQALARHDDLDQVRQGLRTAVEELDQTIGDLRSAIFELTQQTATGLREQVRELALEYARVLGFSPWVCTAGELEQVDGATTRHLVATMRELLSNVARHAGATTCRVEVVRDADEISLQVGDDGRGIDADVRRSGLANVAMRAAVLGGSLAVERLEPHGSLVTWRVPVPGGEGAATRD